MGKTQPLIVADLTPAVLTAATTRRVKSCRANLIPEAQRILVRRPRRNPVRLDKTSISLDVIAGLKLETHVAGTYLSYWSYAVGV